MQTVDTDFLIPVMHNCFYTIQVGWIFLLLLYAPCIHDESNFQLTSIGCVLAPHNIQKISLVILTNTFLKFYLTTFSSVCPKRKIQCSTTFCQWAVEVFGHLYWIKGTLQAWKADFLFVAACSGCVSLLVNLKSFFLMGRVGINLGLEFLWESFQELLSFYRTHYVVSSATVLSRVLGRKRCHSQTHMVLFLHPLSSGIWLLVTMQAFAWPVSSTDWQKSATQKMSTRSWSSILSWSLWEGVWRVRLR